MCGIIGVLGKIPEQRKFEKARDALAHRGPDDSGTYYNAQERVALGHRRLSIIDLSSAGHQPFFSNDGRFVVTFNGEIYNYLEIKEELRGYYDFKTKTDTEVLLAAYLHWKEKCVERFNGMFAFAIWDKKERKLFCARDRLGIKPFFYSIDKDSFFFSSEIKALLALDVPRTPNENIIFDYLYYGMYDHTNGTFFKHISRLPAGATLSWVNGVVTIKKYWDLAKAEHTSAHLSDKEVRTQFKELLTDAINLRFRSDVPVGIGLSSGLDSNTLFHYSKNILGKQMMIFSECAVSDEYNECPVIEKSLSGSEKLSWRTCSMSPKEAIQAAGLLNAIQGEPYGGIPTIATSKRYELITKNGVVVLLDGEGFDDLLGGYKYYTIDLEKDKNAFRQNTKSSFDYSQDMTTLIPRNILRKDFVTYYRDKKISFKKPFQSHLLNAQYRDIAYAKLPRVLRFKDHTSMAYGIELRVPFLDYRFVEFCFFLPSRYKIKNGVHKALARELMEDIVPDSVNERQKKSFGAIQTEWFREYYKKYLISIVASPSFRSRGYWDEKELMKEIDNFYAGKGRNSFFLWQCVNLELWFRAFVD